MSVSIAMIVKNEEKTLGRCLEALVDAVDEIVVVDTGSTDGTQAVARQFTNRVFEYAWTQDFSAARQYAFDQARSDWVGWVDADDVVVGATQIRPLAASVSPDVGAIYWRYALDVDSAGQPQCEFWRERLVRNDGSYRWQGRIHETLVTGGPWQSVRSADVWVEHRSPAERGPARLARNIALLEAEVAAAPQPRPLFYLGREYASAGRSDEALAAYLRYLALATWDDERYLAQTAVAGLLRMQNRLDEAVDADLQAIKLRARWPDAYFGLAQTSYFLGRWADVVHWCDVGRALPPPETDHILNLAAYRHQWIIYYTNALYHLGRPAEALRWTEHALSLTPDDPWHRQNAAFFRTLAA
jgi:glycosyltransferase involved in cell wall biosynthesis